MPALPAFHMVDVFAEQPLSGNPLAVVVSDVSLSDARMQQLAAETNFSETAFVSSSPARDGGYAVRLFTPAREIAFAGHPILGAGWVVRHALIARECESVRLNLAVGQVPVFFENSAENPDTTWFLAPVMSKHATCPPERIAAALNLSPDDLRTDLPVQVISAGTSALVVPLRDLDALKRSMLNLARFSDLAAEGFPPLVYLFCNQTRHARNDFSARFFFEAHGVREDPATGNGAAFLGAYLLEHHALPRLDSWLRIEQGHEIHRPSLVLLRAKSNAGQRQVHVGGRVIATVRGELVCG